MTSVKTLIEPYCLCIDAVDSLRMVLDKADVNQGLCLEEGLRLATSSNLITVGERGTSKTITTLTVAAPDAASVLTRLEQAGYVSSAEVWSDSPRNAYVSGQRTLIAVTVLRAFTLTELHNSWFGRGPFIKDVDARTYLSAFVGDVSPALVGVSATNETDAAALRRWVGEIKEFIAWHCIAEYSRCHMQWLAEDASWIFTPEPDIEAHTWHYEIARHVDAHDTICCPQCRAGRVFFTSF